MAIDNTTEFTGLVSRGDKAINERYRPRTFHEIIGNEATKKALAGWMEAGEKRSRTLLLVGGSGQGKTTIARILAAGLNCEHGDTVNPCCECESCVDAMNQRAMHIVEYNMSALSRKEDADDIVTSMYNSSFTGRNNVYILDECLHYDTPIDCIVDGKVKKIPIGHIVHKRMNVEVLSYNPETHLIEVKPVVNWFKNPKKEVYEWVFERVGVPNLNAHCRKILTCTDNHTVFRYDTNEEIQIGLLKEGDLIRGNTIMWKESPHLSAIKKSRSYYEINDDARQMILGSMLGDGHIGTSDEESEKCNARISEIHCEEQKFYALEKARIYGDLFASGEDIVNGGYEKVDGSEKKAYRFRTKSDKCLSAFYKLKGNLADVLEQLNEVGIAVWYMDDGSLSNNNTVNLSTNSFSEKENDLIIEFFQKKYGIVFAKLLDKRSNTYSLYCCGKNKDMFLHLVSPYVLKEFQGKCSEKYEAQDKLRLVKPIVFHEGINENYVDVAYRFVEKRMNSLKNRRGHVYDIEVADNHNYFASGINVHNCQSMSTSSQNLMLKMLEDPPDNTHVILCTTNPDKILKTVKTRCEQYEVKQPGLDEIKQLLGAVVKQEMPSMDMDSRKQILEACRGLGYREILMKLEKFIKGGGTGSIEEAFQPDYMALAKAVVAGDCQTALKLVEQYEKSNDGLDPEAARRLIRVFLCNQGVYAAKAGRDDYAAKCMRAFRIFDRGFYTDPNPLPTFKADVVEACLALR